ARRALVAPPDLAAEPGHRVIGGVHHPFFHRDDGVVGDLDVLGADLGAALGDVAHAEPGLLSDQLAAVVGVERVHLELGEADEEPGPGVVGLVLLVISDDVADVLAHEALDALAELLTPLDVDLSHAIAVRGAGWGRERRHLLGHLEVERDVGDQVADDREGSHRRHGDRPLGQLVHAGHAHEPGLAVDLGRARPALAGLAVPPAGQVPGLGGLDAVDDVQDDLALLGFQRVPAEVAALGVAPPDVHRDVAHQWASSNSDLSSAGISGTGSGTILMSPSMPPPAGWRWTRLI